MLHLLFFLLDLLVAAGYSEDDAEDGDLQHHGEDEPALGVRPDLQNKMRGSGTCQAHSVPQAKQEDASDDGGDEEAACHHQVDLPGLKRSPLKSRIQNHNYFSKNLMN